MLVSGFDREAALLGVRRGNPSATARGVSRTWRQRRLPHPLNDRHAGQTATVVGRGPSLLRLTAEDFGPGPVLALNHAILTIRQLDLPNPLYSMQKDGCLVPPQAPETLIRAQTQSHRCFPEYQPAYTFDVIRFGLPRSCMSLTFAVALSKLMGCSGARLLAFDAYTVQDFRTVVGTELQTIGRGYLHAAGQAMRHATKIGLPLEWVA